MNFNLKIELKERLFTCVFIPEPFVGSTFQSPMAVSIISTALSFRPRYVQVREIVFFDIHNFILSSL